MTLHDDPLIITGGEPSRISTDSELAALATSLRVVDALLFRRVSPTTWAHLGGLGRGRGWAGIVDVDETQDPLASRIPAGIGEVYRTDNPEPARVFGPYYAVGGAIVRTGVDVTVVLGNPREPLPDCKDADLRRLAELLESSVDDVLPSKRLADELEVLHAVWALMAAPTDSGLHDTLRHIVTVGMQALSCDVGALLHGSGTLAVVAPPHIDVTDATWRAALSEIASSMDDSQWCVQDVTSVPALSVLTVLPGARSLLALTLPPPTGGTLLLVHTDRAARGFTSLCQRLGRHVAEAGSLLANTAALRDELQDAVDRAWLAARTDPLTGLGNRLAWDEAVAVAQERVDAGASVSVLTLDVDDLKGVNDRHGHDAGDDLLRRCAAVIRTHCRPGDVAARMGGDEFAVLLPVDREVAVQRRQQLADALDGTANSEADPAASVGVGTAEPGELVTDAVRDADGQMYRFKRSRRARSRR